jgi:hypothetical protein
MRALLIGLLAAACGAPAATGEALPEMRGEALAAPTEAIAEPERDPCYSIDPAVAERWPEAADALDSALARWWRWYRPGDPGEECPLVIGAIDASSPVVAAFPDDCSEACSVTGLVQMRVDVDSTVSGVECSEHQRLLVDVLTHELGHAWGLEHASSGAMGPHSWCESVVPSDNEILVANECSNGEPGAAGAYCPE